MPLITISDRNAKTRRSTPNPSFRPRLEQLDERTLPSTVSNLVSREARDSSGNDTFRGVDASVDILGASDNGDFLLLQTAATNFSSDFQAKSPQISPPGQVNLFQYDVLNKTARLISALDPASAFQVYGITLEPGQKSLGVEVSTRESLNAVMSADGKTVAFISSANAFLFDNNLPQGLASDSGGTDLFVWNAATGKSTLASRTSKDTAIGNVTNPTLSIDGTSVGFVTPVPAWRILGLETILDKLNTQFLVSNNPNQLPPGIETLLDDYLIRDGTNTPDLFRADVGQTPVPISYEKANFKGTYFDNNNKLVAFNEARYVMHGNIQVDPLNRYSTSGNAGFVAMRNWSLYDGNQTRGKDAWVYNWDPGLTLDPDEAPPVNAVLGFTAKDQTTAPGFNAIGNVLNVFTAQGSGDFFAVYEPLGKTNAGYLLSNYVSNNNNGPELYRFRTAAAGERPQLMTSAFGTTNVGGNGDLDISPAGYRVNSDGTKLLFTSKGTNFVSGVVDQNFAFDIFQRDLTNSPASGGKIFAISVLSNNPLVTGNAESRFPTQTLDGLAVAFDSSATNLTTIPDNNNTTDVYVRDIVAGQTLLASTTEGNQSTGNNTSFGAVVTRRFPIDENFFRNFSVFFSSLANDIDLNYTVIDGLAQVYETIFPIFISQLPKPFTFTDSQGFVYLSTTQSNGKIVTQNKFQPFPGYKGELRVATGDLNGDGVPDIVVGAGPGGGPRVVIIDGFNGRILDDFFAFEPSFRGGVYVAVGDFTGDGKADLVVGAGEGGAPRVQIYDSITGIPLADFFAYEASARTGVRVAAGDFNGNGLTDLFIAAGIGGGPRVRVFDGQSLPGQKLLADLFVFESTQRGGAYLDARDFDGDGKADIIVGAGPEGGPRVRILNAANVVLQDPNETFAFVDFFPFDSNLRTGVRPIVRDIDSDKFGDLIVGIGQGLPRIQTYLGKNIRVGGDPQPLDDIIANGALAGTFGAWVG